MTITIKDKTKKQQKIIPEKVKGKKYFKFKKALEHFYSFYGTQEIVLPFLGRDDLK